MQRYSPQKKKDAKIFHFFLPYWPLVLTWILFISPLLLHFPMLSLYMIIKELSDGVKSLGTCRVVQFPFSLANFGQCLSAVI
jgi:uncharacterized membrane protein (UPF0182 family)